MLTRQWKRFHDEFRDVVMQLPPESRHANVRVFELLLATSTEHFPPAPAAPVWAVAEPILKGWIATYYQACTQAIPLIADFEPDAERIRNAIRALIQDALSSPQSD